MTDRKTTNDGPSPNPTRRALITYLPLGIVAGFVGSMATAAFRFIRPVVTASNNNWIDVGSLSELTGPGPIARTIVAEQVAGWATSTEQHDVYVLTAKNNEVVSAVCPHEGCQVSWDPDSSQFICPCHDSNFAADGSRLSGPARRGLDALPTRVQDGKLQIRYGPNENKTEEQNMRL